MCPADLYLHHNHITMVDDAERVRVEKEIRGQAKRKQWKLGRTKCLHDSNFSKICTAAEKTNFTASERSFTSTIECEMGKSMSNMRFCFYRIRDLRRI